MHELSIARSILDRIASVAELEPGEQYSGVSLRVGEVSGVEPEALRFGLEILARDRGWTPLEFSIERTPLRRRCGGCGFDFAVRAGGASCPQCGDRRTKLAGGDELEITSVEVEHIS